MEKKCKEWEKKLQQKQGKCTVKNKMTLNETVKEALGIALFQLMETKAFSEITIREIANVAGVSRSSFYRNFETKEELLHSYVNSLYLSVFEISQVPSEMSSSAQIQEFLEPRFRFIKEHREIYLALYRNNLLYHFFCQSEKELIRLLYGPDSTLSVYHWAMVSGACAGVIRCWIENGFAEDEKKMAMHFLDSFRNLFLSSQEISKKTD